MDARIREIDAAGKAGEAIRLSGVNDNTFYLFDGEAAGAVCHAIEDLALEEAHGSLLSAFQEFTAFEAQRERYTQLACTIDHIEVLGAGPVPRRTRRLKFLPDPKGACHDFRVVLYDGPRYQALFIGRQCNHARLFEEKQFLGFYTFESRLLERIHNHLRELLAGRAGNLREFARLQALDQAAKQIKSEFFRQTQAVDKAMRRLQLDGEYYCASKFASDLEKGLSRLHQWKTRMPQILAQAKGQ